VLRWRRWGPELRLSLRRPVLRLRWPKFLLLADWLGFTCRRRLVCLLRLTLLELRFFPELRGFGARLLALVRGANLIVRVAAVTLRYRCGLGRKRIL